MLAIPVQGFAASTMLDCTPAHQHTMSGQETTQHPAHGSGNHFAADHQYQATASLNAGGHASGDMAVQIMGADRDLEKDSEQGAHNGSEHAACSLGVAVSASSLRLHAVKQIVERIASEQFLIIGFVTDGPKRPPRTFLA